MIVPQNRLLAVVAAVVLPLAVAGGLRADWSLPAAIGCVVVLAVAGADALLGARGAGRELTFELPETVRLSKDQPGALAVVVNNERPGAPARGVRLGLALPEAVDTPHEELAVPLAAGAARTRLEWPCTGRRRGRYSLARIYYEERSPLGLWAVRRSSGAVTGPCELRVYPDLRAERRRVAAVFLARGGLGARVRRQVGRGREFEKLRDYVAGDGLEDISWKATARRRRPVSKVFQIERTQEVYVIIDRSRLSARSFAPEETDLRESGGDDEEGGTPGAPGNPAMGERPGATALERYVAAALLFCLAAERQGDLFGLATFAEGVGHFVRAKNGTGHFHTCREAIYALEPAGVSPDFEEVCTFLRGRLRRRALLIFLTSSLDDPVLAESFTRAVEPLSRQHLIRVNGLRPAGVAPLFSDPDEGEGVRGTGDVYRRLGGHLRWQRLRERENLLKQLGIRFTLLDPARLTAGIITQYLDVKGRQIL